MELAPQAAAGPPPPHEACAAGRRRRAPGAGRRRAREGAARPSGPSGVSAPQARAGDASHALAPQAGQIQGQNRRRLPRPCAAGCPEPILLRARACGTAPSLSLPRAFFPPRHLTVFRAGDAFPPFFRRGQLAQARPARAALESARRHLDGALPLSLFPRPRSSRWFAVRISLVYLASGPGALRVIPKGADARSAGRYFLARRRLLLPPRRRRSAVLPASFLGHVLGPRRGGASLGRRFGRRCFWPRHCWLRRCCERPGGGAVCTHAG